MADTLNEFELKRCNNGGWVVSTRATDFGRVPAVTQAFTSSADMLKALPGLIGVEEPVKPTSEMLRDIFEAYKDVKVSVGPSPIPTDEQIELVTNRGGFIHVAKSFDGAPPSVSTLGMKPGGVVVKLDDGSWEYREFDDEDDDEDWLHKRLKKAKPAGSEPRTGSGSVFTSDEAALLRLADLFNEETRAAMYKLIRG